MNSHTFKRQILAKSKRTVRKHLNADSLLQLIREDFEKVSDHRADNTKISLDDALMSAFAMFQLKDPSLLAFDKRRRGEPENLHSIYKINNIPCDSQMRDILDPLDLSSLRAPFRSVFRALQRGKDFERMTFIDNHYLLSGDGTGFYSSEKVSSPYCLGKKQKNGRTMYYQQMYAAAFVHPEHKEVIPVFPEMITKQDGTRKNDCERNAASRFYTEFRREHPHLKVVVVEDALASNGPHIRDLNRLNLRYILGAKPGDHKYLFEQIRQLKENNQAVEVQCFDPVDRKKVHSFTFANQLQLNKSNPDLLVNLIEYLEVTNDGKVRQFSWITDLEVTEENVFDLMRAARARWRVENEVFNTLKNGGYNLGHNYGLGKKNLSGVFTILMMLAFLIDQVQQMCCWLFQKAAKKEEAKKYLWETIRSGFRLLPMDSMETLLRTIVYGISQGNNHDEEFQT